MGFAYIQHISRVFVMENIYANVVGKISEARVIIITTIIIEWLACIIDLMNCEVRHRKSP